jgi:hypothetical protein
MHGVPCFACQKQVNMSRNSPPHCNLHLIETKSFRSSMFGGWEETTYRCLVCYSSIEHTNDKNEFAPFWWFTD